MSMSIETEGRLIPAPEICRRLDIQQPTLRRFCARHGVELVRLSPAKHYLTQADFDLLLSRAKNAGGE